ncbi:MAG: hypothetical protein N4Q32_00325 [Neisseriaceae bacterium]|nr:hypothetical protein [Neisseriaceae bacterium]
MLITYCKFVDVWDYKKISKFLINNSSNDIFEENHEELKKIRDGYVAHYNYVDIDDISFSYYKEGQKIIPSYFSFNSQPLDCLYIVLLLENIESLKIFINHKIEKLESIFDSKLSDEDRKILLDNQLK